MKKRVILFKFILASTVMLGQNYHEKVEFPPNLTAPSNSSLTLPRVSQASSITQTIGITELRLDYHRPGVYKRQLLGGADALIPYNQVWRAGANENTTLSISNDIKIAGTEVEAGTYGVFLIPKEKENWVFVLSKVNSNWGAFFYNEQEDILRVPIKVENSFQNFNWLTYYFDNPQYDRVDLILEFGNVKLTIPIEIDVNEIIVNNLRIELKGVSLRNLVAYNQAAEFCLVNNINLKEGLSWAQRASRNDKSFTYLMTEAGLLKKLGELKKGDSLQEVAFSKANAGDLVNYSFRIMGSKLADNREEGLKILELARETKPDGAFPMFAMGQYYETMPNRKKEHIKEAIKFYQMARDFTQVKGLKESMKQRISLLEKEL